MLLFLLILIPAAEIYLFIELGGAIGGSWTFLLILATAFWGLSAMRRQGLAVLAEAQAAQAAGRTPVVAAAHGLLILLAGALLLVPGFLTDTVGFLLLLRPLRALVLETALAAFVPQMMSGFVMRGGAPPSRPQAPDSSEGDYRIDDEPPHKGGEK